MARAPHKPRLHHLRPALAALALAALALSPGRAAAQDLLRWSRGGSSGSPSVTLYADQITTWSDGGRQVFLARGNALLFQDDAKIRFQQGVVRVEEPAKGSSRPYRLQVYAEGDVTIAEGLTPQRGPRGLLELTTRDVKCRATGGPLSYTPAASDPLFQRARALWPDSSAAAADPTGIRLAAAQQFQPVQAGPDTAPPPPPPPPVLDATQAPQTPPPPPAGPFGIKPRPRPPGPPKPAAPPAAAQDRQISVLPRSLGQELQIRGFTLAGGENAVVISSGVILRVVSPGNVAGIIDIEADQMCFWTRGNAQQALSDLQAGQGQKDDGVEFYLAGHVELRSQDKQETRTLRCDEAYYDVKRHVAVALKGSLEITDPQLRDPIVITADDILQIAENRFVASKAKVGSSALPYDPGLAFVASEATYETKPIQRKTIFGLPIIDLKTGQPLTETQRYFTSRDVFLEFEGVPFFYTPILNGDVEHPLGPLESVGVNYNNIFGLQLYTTWDAYQLIGITHIPDTRWRFDIDYLSLRGPALGTTFDFSTKDFLGIPGRYTGEAKAYGIYDTGLDQLGDNRGQSVLVSNPPPVYEDVTHPSGRGRLFADLNAQDLPNGFSYQFKLSVLSDPNFLEQYYLNEFQNDPNQETFLYVKQQEDAWAWTFLMEPGIRNWVTETERLPQIQADALGVKVLDNLLTYNIKTEISYDRLRPTDPPPFAYEPEDAATSTGRADLWQDISLPFQLGAFKIVPYADLDLTYYSSDLAGDPVGRVYGGGGVRASFPLSRLYPGVQSELFNLDGIYHKIVVSGNFYDAYSNIHYDQLPQLDRLNDDISDLTLRAMYPWQLSFNPTNAASLTTSPLFNPQDVALRQLVLNAIDTRDSIDVLQLDVYQRWQTKRGMPGNEHVVDWMTLDLNASIYPQADRDNFGNAVGFLSYDWLWNIGDRTSLVSSGWTDPVSGGPRVFSVGANVSRPDNTSFYLGYRQLDPLESKAVIGAVTFSFSSKYAMTASTVWDFGVHQQSYSLLFTRIGTDVQVSTGINVNSILGTVGFVFEIIPTVVANRVHGPIGTGMGMTTPGAVGR